ncbi:MAG: class I SAM-dependent methyltransferase [Dehalococcoidia bacterium]|nr:MAG: class I SAM-dependent methyltransferase [Dehalococcoidia bacterium]
MNTEQTFADRIKVYVKYLPSYPQQYIAYLVNKADLTHDSIIADIGAGAGVLTKLMAPYVNTVTAVEPNEGMCRAAAEHLRDIANVVIIDGSAEATGLLITGVDFIVAGQSFHYFKLDEVQEEFKRILKPGGMVGLAWHVRDISYPFGREYEVLLKAYCPKYSGSGGGSNDTMACRRFFKDGIFDRQNFPNHRRIDLETLIGYSLSMPCSPVKGDDNFVEFVENLTALYHKHTESGGLELRAEVESFVGEI